MNHLAEGLSRAVRSWRKDRHGVTSLEYGILASILGLELVNIFHGLGVNLTSLFAKVGQSI